MTFFQSVVLGIVQGLTEFIPVSSSGHLIIFPELLGWEQGGLAFDTTLHLGTLTALLVYFYKDLRGMFNSLLLDFKKYGRFFSQFSPESKLVMWLLIATIPAGLGGYFLGDFLEATFRSMLSVAIFLILGSILMLVAEKKTKLVDKALPAPALSFKKILTSGLFQCLALFPGFSRSGATISGGLLSGLNRLQAARLLRRRYGNFNIRISFKRCFRVSCSFRSYEIFELPRAQSFRSLPFGALVITYIFISLLVPA
ncbi:MAG: Undecaprenyl-diphosphatase [candidate division WWE3 bacterium GW2011_GWA1_42_46]|nr:MAG: Undecaprenyl-diphosphatase [candidate division WWE3 bacterium GW2011_GWA1_42_46]